MEALMENNYFQLNTAVQSSADERPALDEIVDDSDIHVTYEDQQKINKFARQNARLEDVMEELKIKENNLENLKYAEDELLPGEDSIPVKFGEVFVALDYDETEETLSNAKQSVKTEIESLKQLCEKIRNNMSELKVQLYTKFGTSINLEPDDS